MYLLRSRHKLYQQLVILALACMGRVVLNIKNGGLDSASDGGDRGPSHATLNTILFGVAVIALFGGGDTLSVSVQLLL